MQLTLSIAITLVTKSAAVMHVQRFYCNYAGGTFCYSDVGGPFSCKQVAVPIAIMQLEVSTVHIQVKLSATNKWMTIFIVIIQVKVSVANHAGCYFLQYITHTTVSIGIVQMTVSVILQLRRFQVTTFYSFL